MVAIAVVALWVGSLEVRVAFPQPCCRVKVAIGGDLSKRTYGGEVTETADTSLLYLIQEVASVYRCVRCHTAIVIAFPQFENEEGSSPVRLLKQTMLRLGRSLDAVPNSV